MEPLLEEGEPPVEQLRLVDTPFGPLTYTLVKKRVKNLNLRVERNLTVVLSVPLRCSTRRADEFIREKALWLTENLRRLEGVRQMELPPEPSRLLCQELLEQAMDRVYPLVAPLGVEKPALKLRRMRSQWGNCHWAQGYITLNTALARCPEALRDYVALHELVHFLHHDHGSGFYARMDALMPDWQRRRRALRQYAGALETEG